MFFVFDPKHESVSFLKPNGLWFKVFVVKTKKNQRKREHIKENLFENALKNLYKIQQLAFISTKTYKVHYHGNKLIYNRLSKLSSSKSY